MISAVNRAFAACWTVFSRVDDRGKLGVRRFLAYHHGIPGARWLNILLNRIDPELFSDCFMNWVSELRPDARSVIAIACHPSIARPPLTTEPATSWQ